VMRNSTTWNSVTVGGKQPLQNQLLSVIKFFRGYDARAWSSITVLTISFSEMDGLLTTNFSDNAYGIWDKFTRNFSNYLRRSRHLESENRIPAPTSLLSTSPINVSEESQCSDNALNYTITPRDILSFAWQISKGMTYLADIKVISFQNIHKVIWIFFPTY